MIQFRRLALARGARRLFADASLQIHPGARVGVVGANGSGKSSLFALLRGELTPESGDCSRPADWRIASVAQETPALAQPAIDYVLDGDSELREVESALRGAEDRGDGHAIAELHARLAAVDGYAARARAAELLDGLGFSPEDIEREVADFSGGWRMRLNLARALISRAPLLLLDEPTNHLDLDAVVWLERWLAGFRGTLLLISHDRDFLDACVTQVLAFERETLQLYAGNYSAWEVQRAERLAVQQAMYERQQRELAHIHRFVERFRAQATKARQVQSRVKALDRMERIAAAHVDTPFDFEFPEPARAPDPLLVLEDASVGYAGRTVLQRVQLSLRPGSRLGLLGPNGAGKSTLIKLLTGELAPLEGRRIEGHGLATGYFAQHQLEQLRAGDSPLQHLARVDPAAREQELRNYLGGFDFRGDMADTAVGPLSGGEKSRLALALIVRARPNLLLLDEPTNHLDLEMRHALTRALAEYPGSLVLVSHDRALLRTICDGFLLVADGASRDFDGDLDDYLEWLEQRRQRRRAAGLDASRSADKAQRLEQRGSAVADRQQRIARRRPLLKEVATLEKQLAASQLERERLDILLGDPEFYAREAPSTIERRARERAELEARIDTAETRWLDIQGELEAIGEA